MLNIGPQELLVILVIALLVVGPQRLPELGRSIGRWMRELRNAQDEVKRTIRVGLDESNGDAAGRPSAGTAGPSPPETGGADPIPGPDGPTPTAGSIPTPEQVRDISQSLGRSLGQIRRAKEEVQRSFRVDLGAPNDASRVASRKTDASSERRSRPDPLQEGPSEPDPADGSSNDPPAGSA